MRKQTEKRLEYLRANAATMDYHQIAKHLKMDVTNLWQLAKRNNIHIWHIRKDQDIMDHRLDQIIRWKREGYTFEQIGKYFGISRQRVHAIISAQLRQ